MDIKIQADQTNQRCSANIYMYVLKVHNKCINCLLGVVGGGAQTPSLSTSPPAPPTSKLKTHADQLKFYIKVRKKKVFDPTTSEETRITD